MAYETFKEKQERHEYWERKTEKDKKKKKSQTKLNEFKKTEITLHDVITKENFVIDNEKRKEFMRTYKHRHRLMVLK